MARGMKWFYWLGVVLLATLALWVPRAESMPPVVAALVVGAVGVVATEPAEAAAAAPTAGQQADKVLSRAMNGIQAAGMRMAGALWREGITLFWMIWTLMFGWTIYKNYHQGEELVGALALYGAVSGFIYIVLMLYMPPRGGVDTWGGSPVYMATIFTTGFDEYAGLIAKTSGISAMGVKWDSMQAVGVKMFWHSMSELGRFAAGAHLVPEKPDVVDYAIAFFRMVPRVFHLALALIAQVVIGLTMVVYVFVVLMADVLAAIGLTLGPIMIPFYLWPVLSHLFDGWLRFMITAGFYKLVATAMLALTYSLVKELELTSIAINQSASGVSGAASVWAGDLASLSLALVIAVLSLLMMWQVPSIASALTSGNAGGDMLKAARTLDNAAKTMIKGGK